MGGAQSTTELQAGSPSSETEQTLQGEEQEDTRETQQGGVFGPRLPGDTRRIQCEQEQTNRTTTQGQGIASSDDNSEVGNSGVFTPCYEYSEEIMEDEASVFQDLPGARQRLNQPLEEGDYDADDDDDGGSCLSVFNESEDSCITFGSARPRVIGTSWDTQSNRIDELRRRRVQQRDSGFSSSSHNVSGLSQRPDSPNPNRLVSAPARSIEVRGISESTADNLLRAYFENRVRSDGGPIKEMSFDSDLGVAVVTFHDEQDAARVLEKHPHTLNRCELVVGRYQPPPPSKTVLVRGLNPSTSRSCIFHYFENTRRSGGGLVTSVEPGPKEGMAFVYFECAQDAENVCLKTHYLDDHELTVTLHVHAVQKKDSVLLGGLRRPSKTDLKNFVESATQVKVKDIHFSQDESLAIVTFPGTVDCNIVSAIRKRKFGGEVLTARAVTESRTVRVWNLPCDPPPTEESLRLHFENAVSNGGGDVMYLELDPDARCAMVAFSDPKVASRVARRQHIIEGCMVSVSLVYDCLEPAVYPQPLPVEDRDGKISSLAAVPEIVASLQATLKEHYACIDVGSASGNILLRCCVPQGVEECPVEILQTWKQTALAALDEKLQDTQVITKPSTPEETEDIKTIFAHSPEMRGVEVGYHQLTGKVVIAWEMSKNPSLDDEQVLGVIKEACQRKMRAERTDTPVDAESNIVYILWSAVCVFVAWNCYVYFSEVRT